LVNLFVPNEERCSASAIGQSFPLNGTLKQEVDGGVKTSVSWAVSLASTCSHHNNTTTTYSAGAIEIGLEQAPVVFLFYFFPHLNM
jgi:hypothetical protein